MAPKRALILTAICVSCGSGDGASGEPASSGGVETTAAPTTGAAGGSTGDAASGGESSGTQTSTASEGGSSTGEPGLPPGPWDAGFAIPETPQAPGDPAAGYQAMLTRGYVTCGVPYVLFGLAKGLLGDFTKGDPLPGRSGKNAEVPYNWTVHTPKSGVEIASLNCLECHAGRFNGELVVGLGEADLDFTDVPMSALVDNLPILDIFPGGVIGEINKFVARYKAVGPKTKMLTVGTNPADMLAVALAAHHDGDTLAWSDDPLLFPPEIMAPVDTPPWWRVHKKHGVFYNGMNRGDHRGTMMFASSLCTDSVAEADEIFDYFDDINAYIRSLRSPVYPFAIDAELAAAGEAVFVARCAGCHGTYAPAQAGDDGETYPNLLLPLEVIGTDSTVAKAGENYGEMVQWFNESYYGKIVQLEVELPFPGYVAPPLDGVWATAPYLHNGSVPTLAALLESDTRPARWRRVDLDSANYDQTTLGWPFIATPYGQDDAPADQRKFVYDTSKPGHGNGGHTFGDALDAGERAALLEYIKTL